MPILRATRRPVAAARRASRAIPAASARTPSPPTANGASRRASTARRVVGGLGEEPDARTADRPSAAGRTADRRGTRRVRGTLSAAGSCTGPRTPATRLSSCATARPTSAGLAASRTKRRADATAGSARTAETAGTAVSLGATCRDAASDRSAGASTRNVTGLDTGVERAVSAVTARTGGGLAPAIVTPASGVSRRTGAPGDESTLCGDVAGELDKGSEVAVGAGCADEEGAPVAGDGVGTGATAGAGDVGGGDGGRTATGADTAAGAVTASGVGVGAGDGAALGGRSPSGSTYPSSSAACLIPRWTLGSSCSGVPLTPIVPTVSPSPTVVPFATSIVPRWTSVTA